MKISHGITLEGIEQLYVPAFVSTSERCCFISVFTSENEKEIVPTALISTKYIIVIML